MSNQDSEIYDWVPYDGAPTSFHMPQGIDPQSGGGKAIFPVSPSDRERAEREILGCADILGLARTKWKGLSVPRLFTGDIEWNEKTPALVWNTADGSVSEMHFSLRSDAFSVRGVILYRDDTPDSYVLDYENGRFRYSVVARRDARGEFCIDRSGRMPSERGAGERARRIAAVVCASVCTVGVLGALILSYVTGARRLREENSDTAAVFAEQTETVREADLILLQLTDPAQAGAEFTVTVMGKPETEYQVSCSAFGSELPKGTAPTRSDRRGTVSFTFKLPKNLAAGTYWVTVFDRTERSSFSFTVAAP